MPRSYRAKIGHAPNLGVVNAGASFAGQPVTLTLTSGTTSYDFNDGFETGGANIDLTKYSSSTAGSGTRLPDTTHSREGSRSLHTLISKSGTVNYRQEVQIISPASGTAIAGSQEYWLGISIYIPSTSSNVSRSHLLQWHTHLAGGFSPILSLMILSGNLNVHREIPGTTNTVIHAVTTNVWMDYVFRILWRTDATGIFQIWENAASQGDTPIYSSINSVTAWSGDSPLNLPHFKCGRYSSAWNQAGNPDANGTIHETWHDSIRLAFGSNLFNAVKPVGNRLSAP